MEESILSHIISGYYTDWFINVFLTNITLTLKNNLELLLIVSLYFVKFSRRTSNKWDNKIADWFRSKITRDTEKE